MKLLQILFFLINNVAPTTVYSIKALSLANEKVTIIELQLVQKVWNKVYTHY